MQTTRVSNTTAIRRRSGRLAALMLSAASLALPGALQAEEATEPTAPQQTEDGATALGEITLDGDWLGGSTEVEAATYPGARDILSENELHGQGNRSIEDALRKAPSVRIEDETGTGVLPNIGVRGLNPLRSERAMLLLDGIPLALAPYTGTGLSLFPATLETIDRIDIVRGGGAVHYGPNNVSGVINLISKPIPQEFSGTAKQKFTVDERTGNLLSDSYLRLGGFVTPDFALQAQINTVTGKGGRNHSDTDVLNFILDGEWYLGDTASLKGRLQYYDVEADLPGALTPAAYEADRSQSQRPHDAFDADTLRASLTYNRLVGESSEFNWVNYVNLSDRSFDFGVPFEPDVEDTLLLSSPREFFVAGTEPRFTHQFHIGNALHELTFGVRYVREDVDYRVDRRDLATGGMSTARDWYFETDAYAAYVSDTIELMNSRLQVTPGLRYEYVDTFFKDRATGTASRNKTDEFLPGLTVGYQVTDKVFLFGNANRSLRVPQVSQVTRAGDVANELAWNYELGVRFAPDTAFTASATVYRIDFSDQIEFDRPSLTFQNLGKTRHQGFEIEAEWQPTAIPGLSLAGNYTFSDTEQLVGAFAGNRVPFASKHQVNVTVDYAMDSWTFGLNGSYRSTAFSDAANTATETADGSAGPLPSAWVWNLQVSKELDLSGTKTRLIAAVNNLFDEDYYFRGVDVSPIGRVPQPGRSFTIGLQADF